MTNIRPGWYSNSIPLRYVYSYRYKSGRSSVNSRCCINVALMLGHRLRRWPSTKPTLIQRLLVDRLSHIFTWLYWSRYRCIDSQSWTFLLTRKSCFNILSDEICIPLKTFLTVYQERDKSTPRNHRANYRDKAKWGLTITRNRHRVVYGFHATVIRNEMCVETSRFANVLCHLIPSHHPQEVVLTQFGLYVHGGGLKHHSLHFLANVLSQIQQNNMNDFHPLEIVDRGSETQLQVGENLN